MEYYLRGTIEEINKKKNLYNSTSKYDDKNVLVSIHIGICPDTYILSTPEKSTNRIRSIPNIQNEWMINLSKSPYQYVYISSGYV